MEKVDCMRCAHLPLCIYISQIDSNFRFPAEGANCGMYSEDNVNDYDISVS